MNALPQSGLLRERQLLGDRKANPPIPPIIPISKACWWEGVKSGRFPKPIKLGPKITCWRVEDIRRLIEGGGTSDQARPEDQSQERQSPSQRKRGGKP